MSRTFPAFPEERWLQIVPYIALDPGTVEITQRQGSLVRMRRRGGLPHGLQLNRETLTATLPNYRWAFRYINAGHGMLFNFDLDTLDISSARPRWHSQYQSVLPDLARVRYLVATHLLKWQPLDSHWGFDFASLSPYVNLQRVRIPRHRDASLIGERGLLNGGFETVDDYDDRGHRYFVRWWTNNMPATSPVPELVFYWRCPDDIASCAARSERCTH